MRQHPLGLYILSFAEAGERFGFYLMFTLFCLFLNEKLGYTEGQAMGVFSTYLAMVYFTPFFGGIIGDRWLGHQRSVIFGASWLAAGYAMFALGGVKFMWIAFVVLAIGNGLFKSSISTLVGKLYPPKDEMLDSAFTIFYMGINVGAGIAPFAGEYTKAHYGWVAAFLLAAFVMMLSLFALILFGKLPGCKLYCKEEEEDKLQKISDGWRVVAITIFSILAGVFFFAFHQNGSTMTFWARDNTIRDIHMFGKHYVVPTTWYSAINSICIIVFSMVILLIPSSWFKKTISTPIKITMGLFLTALSYGILTYAASLGNNHHKVHMLYLIISILIISIGELCISPMGLAMISKLAPRKLWGLCMGIWFMCIALGNKASGLIGPLWDKWPHRHFWALLSCIVLGAAFVLLILRKWLTKLSE